MNRCIRACFSVAALGLAALTASPSLAQAPKNPAPQQQDLIAKGQALFDDQQYEESIQTLSAALLRPNSTKQQKVEIYRLLALDYITLGRKDEAESAVRGLLAQRPEYQLPQTESPRFREFFADVRRKWEAEGRPGLEQTTERPPPAPQVPPSGIAKRVALRHQSPPQVEPDKAVELRAQVIDPSGASKGVRVYYRTGTSGDFTEEEATLDEHGNVRAQIPASAVKPPIVEYYFVVADEGGGALATRGDDAAPLRIAVSQPSKGWVLPVAIGGGILGAAAIVGGLALAGVFKGSSSSDARPRQSTVTISIGEAGFRFR